jgi:hypothetical protein
VEFAFASIVVLAVMLALWDLGRVAYAQNAITEAAREAVRVGIIPPRGSGDDPPDDADYELKYQRIRDAALAAAAGVGLTNDDVHGAADDPADPGDDCAPPDPVTPSACFYPGGTATGSSVVVNITVTVPVVTPFLPLLRAVSGSGSGDFADFVLSATSVGTVQ